MSKIIISASYTIITCYFTILPFFLMFFVVLVFSFRHDTASTHEFGYVRIISFHIWKQRRSLQRAIKYANSGGHFGSATSSADDLILSDVSN